MRLYPAVLWAFASGPVVGLLARLPGAAWPAMLGYHAGCVAVARGVRCGPRPARRGLLLVGLGGAAATLLAAAVAHRIAPAVFGPAWSRWGLAPPGDAAWLAWYVVVNPWVEERFWRGALLASPVRDRLGERPAWGLAALGFLGHHAAVLVATFGPRHGVALTLPVLAASLLWTWLARRTDGVWWSGASHQGVDLGLGIAYLLWLRG